MGELGWTQPKHTVCMQEAVKEEKYSSKNVGFYTKDTEMQSPILDMIQRQNGWTPEFGPWFNADNGQLHTEGALGPLLATVYCLQES